MLKFNFFVALIFALTLGNAAGNTDEFSFLRSIDPTLMSEPLTRHKIIRLSEGIYFYQFQYEKLYGVKMSISLLMIDWKQSLATLGIDFSDGKRLPVSTMAVRSHALAATNGTYFMVRESLPYFPLKINGVTRNPPGKSSNRGCGAIAFNFGSAPYIGANLDSLDAQYANIIQGDHIVSQGKSNQPMLDGKGKAPHTAWGVTKSGWTIMLVVDGRTAESGGMNYGELADYLAKIGCVEAVSIDGGGSSAFYLSTQQQNGFNGIVSHPSDNLRFDHGGERSVHDIIYLQLIPEFPKSPPDTDKPGGKSSAPDANPPLNAAKKHEALDGESMKTRQIF